MGAFLLETKERSDYGFYNPAPFLFMYYVYVIKSLKTKELYFGRTENLKGRLSEHNNGRVASTQAHRPWEYVYIEGYKSKKDATIRESQLKQYGNARTYVKKRLANSLT